MRATAGVLALVAIVVWLVGAPVAGIVLGSLTDTPPGTRPHFTFAILADAYADAEHLRSLGLSIVFSAIVATCVLVIGGALAFAAARTDSAVSRLADLFSLAPILIPSVVFVAGWILLAGPKNGLLNLLAVEYLGFERPPLDIYSFTGMIWVAALQEIPLAFLWLWPAFRAMNPDLEDAALVAGASAWTTLRRVSLPLLRPALFSAWIIFFIYTLGALMVPLMIGLPAKIILFSTEIYLAAQRVPSDLNLASAYSLAMLATTAFGVYAYRRATLDSTRFATVTGKAFNPRILRLGRWRPLVTASAIVVLLLVAGLPLLVLLWNAFMPFPQAPSVASLARFTLGNFRAALEYGPAVEAFLNSLWLGAAAGVITAILGAIIAWTTLRLKRPRRTLALLDQLATLPIAMPGMIVGVSLLAFYLMVPLPIYATPWILLIAYVTLHLPYAVRILSSGLTQLHTDLEDAGRVAGAEWHVVFRRIVARLIAPSLVAAVVYVALRSFREYAASIFLVAPGTPVFSVLVLDMWDTGAFNRLSAYVTMVVLVLGLVVATASWLSRRMGTEVRTS